MQSYPACNELRGIATLHMDATLSNCFYHPSEKRVYSKRKEFAPKDNKAFPLRKDSFSEGTRGANSFL